MTDLIQSADAYHLRELIQHDNKIFYVVPRYQREYTWGKNEWEKLLDDVLEDRSAETFLGTIICVNVTRGGSQGIQTRVDRRAATNDYPFSTSERCMEEVGRSWGA